MHSALEARDPEGSPNIELIQDLVEQQLMNHGFNAAAKAYILYRADRTRAREANTALMHTIDEITRVDARSSNMKRDNANIDGNTAMGSMLQTAPPGPRPITRCICSGRSTPRPTGRETSISMTLTSTPLTTTCCQIDILKLFHGGFSTGHGYLREPQSIQSYAALAAIAIQANQNDQHGGQSIPNFDYGMAEGVAKTYRKTFRRLLGQAVEDILDLEDASEPIAQLVAGVEEETGETARLENTQDFDRLLAAGLERQFHMADDQAEAILKRVRRRAWQNTDRDTYQAMEGFVHNLNTMHSRAGAQTPFSSINYGTDTSPEGRMAMRNVLLALDAGLGHGETCIFPIHIFKVKEGVNYNPGDPNYDLFRLQLQGERQAAVPQLRLFGRPL